MTFSVRPGQGESSRFDLGDILCAGESGNAGSAGHVPDQGVMIYLSVTHLLDCLRPLFAGGVKAVSFTGSDSSFGLDFSRDSGSKAVVSVSAQGRLLGRSSLEELGHAVLLPAQQLAESHLSRLPVGDAVRSDYLTAVRDVRALVG